MTVEHIDWLLDLEGKLGASAKSESRIFESEGEEEDEDEFGLPDDIDSSGNSFEESFMALMDQVEPALKDLRYIRDNDFDGRRSDF